MKNFQFELNQETSKAYLIGGGIASLASAVYLIKEGFPAANIRILEAEAMTGGAMQAQGDGKHGYLMKGGRMFDREAYTALFNLLEMIPSLARPGNNVKEDIFQFSKEFPTDSHARLISANYEKVDVTHLGLSLKDSAEFSALLLVPEVAIEGVQIDSYFSAEFFKTNFWLLFCTTFAFQPWHSLIELKRYFKRFLHEVPRLQNLSGVWRTIFNQYDSIIFPIETWIREQGVKIDFGIKVTSLDFVVNNQYRAVDKIHFLLNDDPATREIQVNPVHDLVFTTLGSLTAASTVGSYSSPALKDFAHSPQNPSFALWKNISKRQPDFGNPDAFCSDPLSSAFVSFSSTVIGCDDFMKRMVEWSGNEAGTGALVTFKDSSCLISIVVPHQPHFANQPKDAQVFWGYALKINAVGDFVKKEFSQMSGKEIMQEVLGHLRFQDIEERVLASTNCIPAMLPYTMSQFMPRKIRDRPEVVPSKSLNFAFLGQFVEVEDDVVFTVEYSVRCAQVAVFKLLNSNSKVTPIYRGWTDIKLLAQSAKAVLN